jgi:hypothetical protein
MRRTIAVLALTCLAATALGAGVAQARPGQLVLVEAPAQLRDQSTRADAIERLQSLGANSVRILLNWNTVSPDNLSRVRPSVDLADPASYNWGDYASEVADVKAAGLKVLLTISGPAPRWATQGAKDHITNPRASDFQNFATAAAKQFGTVPDFWAVWNEPNFRTFLAPQFDKKKQPASPAIYRGLYIAAQKGLAKGGLKKAKLLIGETAPRAGADGVGPLAFLRGMLCLDKSYKRDKKCAKLNAYGYAHHPYASTSGPFFKPAKPDDVTIGVLSRLTSALDKASRAGALPSKMRVFLTEFGVQSFPDKLAGVSEAKQSDYRSISERIAYGNSRVYAFSQYLLKDDAIGTTGSKAARYSGFQSGLQYVSGKEKPAYDGFRLPLVATPGSGGKVALWGMARPARKATTITLQRAAKGSKTFKTFAKVKTKSDGTFSTTTTNATGRTWRLQWTAPDGETYVGSATAAYKKP